MAEPTLNEIANINADPERATGQPAVVYDDKPLLDSINQNAQLKAANDWKKYQQFLGDYETRIKNQQEIADKEVADSDREYLKSQSIDLFKDALSDPYKIYSPEFNTKLAGIRANAISSKAARDFAEKNAQFIVQHPEFNTDENKAKIDDYLHNQTVQDGGRKMFTLDVPDVFDTVANFSALRNDPRVKEMVNANRVDEKQGLTYERQDTKYKYKPFLELVKLQYESTPQIQRKAKRDFESLPENVKRNFEDARDYWVNFGSRHFGSFDDVTEQGKEVIQNYNAPMQKAELAERRENNRANRSIEWAKIGVDKDKIKALQDLKKNTKATTANGGLIPYWDNYILPQLNDKNKLKGGKKTGSLWWKKTEDLPADFSGDVDIKSDEISGIGMALFGEVDDSGKQRGYTKQNDTKVRYENGVPIGIVVDGVFYDKSNIDSKATSAENKSMSSKVDDEIYIQGTQPQTGTKKYKGLDANGNPIFE